MKKKLVDSEDSDLFRASVGEVRAIKQEKISATSPKPKPYPKRTQDSARDLELPEGVGREEVLAFTTTGLPKDVLKKLRSGYFPIEAEIDLHGLTAYEAKRELFDFIKHCMKDGCHCIHVVHGKGYRSDDAFPVLKNHLNKWLRQHHDVLAFCSAADKDGGAGAVYVLLAHTASTRR